MSKRGGYDMLNTNYSEKFVKEGLTYDDVLLIPSDDGQIYYLVDKMVGVIE